MTNHQPFIYQFHHSKHAPGIRIESASRPVSQSINQSVNQSIIVKSPIQDLFNLFLCTNTNTNNIILHLIPRPSPNIVCAFLNKIGHLPNISTTNLQHFYSRELSHDHKVLKAPLLHSGRSWSRLRPLFLPFAAGLAHRPSLLLDISCRSFFSH